MTNGYGAEVLKFGVFSVKIGERRLLTIPGGVDEAPAGVESVRLVNPLMKKDGGQDGAKIKIPPRNSTPVQRFSNEVDRTFIEEPIKGEGAWVGVMPDGGSYMYVPDSTFSLTTRKREGSLQYGTGWVQCWINLGRDALVIGEWCIPKFVNEGIEVLNEGEETGSLMFWGLLRLLRDESLRREDSPQA